MSLNWEEVKKNPDEILNLAEHIAIEKSLKFVICIDEFQNISEFENPLVFQKKLRSLWQKHQKTTYCLFGSKRHMLMEVFTSPSMPFYKFGDVLLLEKIEEKEWISFIISRFSDTGKNINEADALNIIQLTECHPYYVQQLAQQVWLRTEKHCTNEIVSNAFESLAMQLSLLFQTLTDDLSKTQVNFLNGLIRNAKQFSSKKTIKEFNLGTSANVLKIKRALLKREIIDVFGDRIVFYDPLYKYWLKRYYFLIKD